MNTERRRAPRAPNPGRLLGRLLTLDAEVIIREISLGGMSVESDVPFPMDAVHRFDLFLGDGASVAVLAQVRHCRLVEAGAHPRYLTGFQFLDGDAPDDVGPIVETLS